MSDHRQKKHDSVQDIIKSVVSQIFYCLVERKIRLLVSELRQSKDIFLNLIRYQK